MKRSKFIQLHRINIKIKAKYPKATKSMPTSFASVAGIDFEVFRGSRMDFNHRGHGEHRGICFSLPVLMWFGKT